MKIADSKTNNLFLKDKVKIEDQENDRQVQFTACLVKANELENGYDHKEKDYELTEHEDKLTVNKNYINEVKIEN